MDRTKNLLDKIGGCSHPSDGSAPCEGDARPETSQPVKPEIEASRESNAFPGQSQAQASGSDEVSLAVDSKLDVSLFATDPYVAQPISSSRWPRDEPKSISEILKNLHGYHNEMDRHEVSDGFDQRVKIQVSQSSSSSGLNGVKLSSKNTSELTSNNLEVGKMDNEHRIEIEMVDANTSKTETTPPKAPHTTAVEVLPVIDRANETIDGLEDLLLESTGEYDIQFLGGPQEFAQGKPDPIRNAFDLDPDYFDYAQAEFRRDRRFGANSSGLMGPQFRRSCDGSDQASSAVLPDATTAAGATPENNCFWVKDGELISIDGNDGFRCIDLACFDVSAASFQASRIEIQCDDGMTFQIEYSNVSHALFANGVEIELATRTYQSLPR